MLHEMLVRHCAPTLAGLKTGSLFSCPCESARELGASLRRVNRLLRGKGLRALALRRAHGRALVYLYRPRMLARDLRDPGAQRLLRERGYPRGGPALCVARLIRRLRAGGEFPHEIGLFLGYPPEDVDGFIRGREKYKLCGMWKVYGDAEAARRQFERCRLCTREFVRRYGEGCPLDVLAAGGR